MNNIVEQVENLIEQNDDMKFRIKQLEEQNARLTDQIKYYTQLNYDLKLDMCRLQDSKLGSAGKVPSSNGKAPSSVGAKGESALEKDLKYMERLEATIESLRKINAGLTKEKNKQLEENLALQNRVESLTSNLAEAQADKKHLAETLKNFEKACEFEHKRAEALDAIIKNSSSGRAKPNTGSNATAGAGSNRVSGVSSNADLANRYLKERVELCDAMGLWFELFK